MDMIAQNRRYLPHEITTKIHSVELYRQEKNVRDICRKYHISKASLMRWNKQYDGTRESLLNKSHRPKSPHPKSHTETELKWIEDLHRRNPDISLSEMYGKLKVEKGYSRHLFSLYRVFIRLGYRRKVPSTKKLSKHLGHYETPQILVEKWQMDVKYVPKVCYSGTDLQPFFQYTMIEEASRMRFIWAYKEQSGHSTNDFVRRAIQFFRYVPKVIQTDNGTEFTNFCRTERKHSFDLLCEELGITHKLIRPRTPWHNGKVEHRHRNDQERFYNYLHFYSYDDLLVQMKRYLYRSNRIPTAVLGWKFPAEKQKELLSRRASSL